MPGAFRTFQTHLAGRRDNPGAEGIVIPQNPPPCCAPETPPRPRQLAFNDSPKLGDGGSCVASVAWRLASASRGSGGAGRGGR